jgi:hypothetical protein
MDTMKTLEKDILCEEIELNEIDVLADAQTPAVIGGAVCGAALCAGAVCGFGCLGAVCGA